MIPVDRRGLLDLLRLTRAIQQGKTPVPSLLPAETRIETSRPRYTRRPSRTSSPSPPLAPQTLEEPAATAPPPPPTLTTGAMPPPAYSVAMPPLAYAQVSSLPPEQLEPIAAPQGTISQAPPPPPPPLSPVEERHEGQPQSLILPMRMPSEFQVVEATAVQASAATVSDDAAPAAPVLAAGAKMGSVTDALFDAIDADHDGHISRSEFRTALRGSGLITPGGEVELGPPTPTAAATR